MTARQFLVPADADTLMWQMAKQDPTRWWKYTNSGTQCTRMEDAAGPGVLNVDVLLDAVLTLLGLTFLPL